MAHGSSCCHATSNAVRRISGSIAAAVAVQQAMVSGDTVSARLQQAVTMHQVMEW